MRSRLRDSFRGRALLLEQLIRFVAVGVTNTLLSLLVYSLLIATGVPYPLAGAIGFTVGAVNGYVLNRRWTFACEDSTAVRGRYLAVQLAGAGATTGLLWLTVSVAALGPLAGYTLTVPLVTLATFAANRSWAFATRGVAARIPL
jgi:putative flippase GtrA